MLQYADDIKLFLSVPEHNGELQQLQLQSDINKVVNWSAQWKLPINTEKCSYMIISKQKGNTATNLLHSGYWCNGTLLVREHQHNDLGVYFVSDWSFQHHIEDIIHKSLKMSALIRKCFKFTSLDVKLRLYTTFVRPKLEYCSVIWSPFKKGEIETIEKVQRCFTKFLLYNSSMDYNDCLNILQLPTLKKRRDMLDVCLCFKIINDMIPLIRMTDLNFIICSSERRSCDLMSVMSNRKQIDAEFAHHVRSLWNSIPCAIRCSSSYSSFVVNLHKNYNIFK